ncbi:6-phosphofructokinase 2 [Rhodopseudomonas rhenobacensis]|uniref:Phosphofructokinase n=1 Tax=Rhodopseudomonas rhenobacensis TaxID=87461 RepID=A0A7W7Z784_9BRAD|nr:1-phosphofructokinase family hexose kinase [Rhodopseudomonas rhenobacensis]MBB5049284.1 6-phosphofructokinase 2 [Rhodopseudomonas rhenobacensis]
MPQIITVTPSPAIDASTSVGKITAFSKLRCAPLQRHPGGGGINVARVIHRLGGEVRAVYPSGGATGELLRELLDREAINGITVAVAAETREDFTVFEESTKQQFRFMMPGSPLTDPEWTQLIQAALVGPPSYIIASGSVPPGAPEDFFGRIVQAGAAIGARVVVDTSRQPLKAALQNGLFLIKPSLSEFWNLTGLNCDDDATLIDAARDLIDRGLVEMVALSMGPNGALLITRDRALRAEGLAVEAATVSGAGDSFLAAMLWSLQRDPELATALRFGIAAGTAALVNPGTELARPQDIASFLPQVRIRELAEVPRIAASQAP